MMNKANRILLVIVGLTIIAAIAASIFGARSVKQLDRHTPAGAVQAYLSATLNGRNDVAAKYLAPDSPCKVEDLDRVYINTSSRVTLVDTQLEGSLATVRVSVETPTGGPFESFNTESHSYRLVQVNDHWLLSGIPWPLWDCGVVAK
ncbi:hypothetical protein GALL_375100 [mine drainage metagenome]|uniref:DUF4878 domain-containing protein n=1 Tax=mine drainage metagenome TaxID=410659 RepID=A0A1J5QAR4_9ZZZZ